MLGIRLHGLLENLLDVCVLEIRLVAINFLGHFNLTLSQNVQILSLFTLLVDYVAAIADSVLNILYQFVQLSVGQLGKYLNISEVYLHLNLFALFLQVKEILIIFVLEVEKVSILDSPHGSVASAFTHIAQMLVLPVSVAQAELSEVVALIDLGEDDLLRLKCLIEADGQLRVAHLGDIIILLCPLFEVDLVWLLFLLDGR